jgi:hypothetical protein
MMFAHNNDEIDYLKLAVVNAHLIKTNLDIHEITVVTDKYSLAYAEETMGREFIDSKISNIILIDKDQKFKEENLRIFKDTSHTAKPLQFYNLNRCDAYDLSPYDETIMIDADYLILSDSLNQCWDHENEIMMDWDYQDIMFERDDWTLPRLNDMGITMYWATVVYFRKTPYVETFFKTVQHVKNNRRFYGDLYTWRGGVYRNDYSFSIAAHMMSGFVDKGFPQLPMRLYKSWDTDDVLKIDSCTNIVLYLEIPNNYGEFILCRWKDVDIHVMNKWAIGRISEDILGLIE